MSLIQSWSPLPIGEKNQIYS